MGSLPVTGRRTSSCVQHTLSLCTTLSKRVRVSVLVVGMEYWDQHKKVPAAVWSRPASARGTFLRIISVNDVYKLGNYPRVATAVKAARAAAKDMDFVCISTLPGDFLSPCALTSLDGGRAMMKGLSIAQIDYACLGNHELDLGFVGLESILDSSSGTAILNSNMDVHLQKLPKFATVSIGDRTAVLGGFLTDDISIYPPSTKPSLRSVSSACIETWNAAKASDSDHRTPDLFIPMTHQLTAMDRKTAVALAQHDELKTRTPVILAGHDHEVFIEEAGQSVIVKVGADATNIGIVDIWWTAENVMKSAVHLLPATEFELDHDAKAFVDQQETFLKKLMGIPIAKVPTSGSLSTKKVRFEESAVATMLLSFVKRGLAREKVEVAMIQGGAIRAGADYAPGAPFLMGDLFSEFAFDCHQAIIDVPGRIIVASVQSTRSAPKPAANFLHLDDGCVVQYTPDHDTDGVEQHKLIMLNGQPVDLDRVYRVAIYQFLLTGLNVIEPLLSYVREYVKVPDVESCRPVKDIVMECCMKDAWRQLIGLNHWDGLHHSAETKAEMASAIKRAFEEMDTAQDGFVHPDELESYMKGKQSICNNHALIVQMIRTLDQNGDGKLSMKELTAIAI